MHPPPRINDWHPEIWQCLDAVLPGEMNAMFATCHRPPGSGFCGWLGGDDGHKSMPLVVAAIRYL